LLNQKEEELKIELAFSLKDYITTLSKKKLLSSRNNIISL